MTYGKLFLPLALLTISSSAQQIKYLNGIFKDEVCEISNGVNGTCQKISDCMNEYENYRKKESVLKICSYDKIELNTLVCCPQEIEQIESFIPAPLNLKHTTSQSVKKLDLLDFESCRDEFLSYRTLYINNQYFVQALEDKTLPLSKENCELLESLNVNSSQLNAMAYGCERGHLTAAGGAYYGSPVSKGDRPNMAAIGIALNRGSVDYICGGSIITNRFIVTAAHCKFYKEKQVNTVRVGDRYLMTKEDDDIAQQLQIQHFISHPNYRSNLKYNDIAMIKTVEEIKFSSFVVPSCIDDLNSNRSEYSKRLTVAGYGQTEDGISSNILLEIGAEIISNSKCNETYQDHDDLPYGIIDSQICVENGVTEEYYIQDTCFGDSGSPLQFTSNYEVFPEDFNTTYLSKVYVSSTVLGLVSFGIGCGLKAPSVYTKLYYFRDWMRDVIETK